jgi:P27 family predicted phage terminase small subunit
MGRRGPPKTPTAALQARGSWRAEERKDAEMPDGIPDAPPHLKGPARELWFRLLPLLTTARILRQTDGQALARYCTLWQRWRECEEFVDKVGMVRYVKDETGSVVDVIQYPQVATSMRLAEALTRLEDRFGLNPSARASVGSADAKPPATGKDRFFA